MTTPVRWWNKLVVIAIRITSYFGVDRRKDHELLWLWSPEWSPWYRGYRVVGYPWCCARIVGKGQAPCGPLLIATVLFIPSLIWSWDDCVMSEVGKWCMWWLRGNPSRINGACSVIMLHASIVRFISSCHVHIVLAISYQVVHARLSWWSHDNSCLTCKCHADVCLECFWLLWACKYIQCTDLACHASFVGRTRIARLIRRARP